MLRGITLMRSAAMRYRAIIACEMKFDGAMTRWPRASELRNRLPDKEFDGS